MVFLLSPANCGGKRAGLLMRAAADFDLARRLRAPGGAGVGELFSFMSGLYFRGKIAYVNAFAEPGGALVIVPGVGLRPPGFAIDLEALRAIARVAVDLDNPRYLVPLRRDAEALAARLHPAEPVVLLGSIATPKYLGPLREILGARLCVPRDFIGRGDMSRGALMLQCAGEGRELVYVEGLVSGRGRAAAANARG